MDEDEKARIWGAITAQNTLLEHLWAFSLAEAPDPAAVTRAIAAKVLAEFDLPPAPEDTGEFAHVVTQHALTVLEEFWDRVEARAMPPAEG